jgi:hypothetical protein
MPPQKKTPNREPLAVAGLFAIGLAGAAVVGAGLHWGRPGVSAAGQGALLSLINLFALERLASRAARRATLVGGGAAAAGLQAALSAKTAILLVAIILVARGGAAGPTLLPFALGLMVSVFALLLAALVTAFQADDRASNEDISDSRTA